MHWLHGQQWWRDVVSFQLSYPTADHQSLYYHAFFGRVGGDAVEQFCFIPHTSSVAYCLTQSTGNTRNISYHTHTHPSSLTGPPACHIKLQHNRSPRETTEILNISCNTHTHTHTLPDLTHVPTRLPHQAATQQVHK